MMRNMVVIFAALLSGCYKPPSSIMAAGVQCDYVPESLSSEKYRNIKAHAAAYDCGDGARATAFFSVKSRHLLAITSTDVKLFLAYLDFSNQCAFLGTAPPDYHLSAGATAASIYSCISGGRTLRLESSTSSLFIEELWMNRNK